MKLQKYNVNWDTYSDHLQSILQQMLSSNEFADVTLVTDDDKQIKAHRNILSACSPVFKKILQSCNTNNHPVIYLRGIRNSEMESLMQFIYMGKTSIYQDRVKEFLMIGNDLEIKDLGKNVENKVPSINTNPVMTNCVTDVNDDKDVISSNETNKEMTNDDTNDDDVFLKRSFEEDYLSSVNLTGDEKENTNFASKSEIKIPNDTSWQCPHCDKSFSDRLTLHSHQKHKHKGLNYFCHRCEFECKDVPKLISHIQYIHEGLKFSCDKCEYETPFENHLTDHIQARHEGHRYTCSQCDYQALRKETIRDHILYKHEGVKYSCDKCDYVAGRMDGLNKHNRNVHEGVRHTCDQCEKQFTEPSSLKVHKKSVHEGIKHKCDFCDWQVVRKGSLKHHILTKHNDININMNIKCKHCEKHFKQMKAYTDHMKNIHFLS